MKNSDVKINIQISNELPENIKKRIELAAINFQKEIEDILIQVD